MADKMPVTPAVLMWARERAGYALHDLVDKYPKLSQWETGDDQPSYAGLSSLSRTYKVPIAVFFMPAPPAEPQLTKHFRTIPAYEIEHLPVSMRRILREALAMQINLAELHEGRNPAQKLIFRDIPLTLRTNLSALVAEVRDYLGVTVDDQSAWKNEAEAFEKWRDVFVQHGIYVFKDAFKTPAFSGFCLYDSQFPVIYVNNSTAPTKQIFTLFHELAHLLFNTSGIDKEKDDYMDGLSEQDRFIETLCNKFAAAFLVPDSDFDALIQHMSFHSDSDFSRLANRYKVSRAVILLKLLTRGLVTEDYYQQKVALWDKQFHSAKQEKGGNYYNTEMVYLGKRYINLALGKFYQNAISSLQLADYLNIKLGNLPKFEEMFLGARA